jgi:hypothetical protein
VSTIKYGKIGSIIVKGVKKMNDDQLAQSNNPQDSYVDTYQPPMTGSDPSSSGYQPSSDPDQDDALGVADPVQDDSSQNDFSQVSSENLEDQNIFDMLGVSDGTEEEREAFLDELQQVIWEDFLENDVKLLVTSEEQVELNAILNNNDLQDLEKQEQVVTYLEKLIPDLEDIMLEKALELKAELFKERILGTRDFFQEDQDKQRALDEVLSSADQGKWLSATQQLNALVQ